MPGNMNLLHLQFINFGAKESRRPTFLEHFADLPCDKRSKFSTALTFLPCKATFVHSTS